MNPLGKIAGQLALGLALACLAALAWAQGGQVAAQNSI